MEMYFRFPNFKTKAVTLSYDDGTIYDRQLIEVLDKYGIKCTFNLNSGLFGKGNHLKQEEVKTLYKNHEIAVHTYSHPHLEYLTDAEVCLEILDDRRNLETMSENIVDGMAYPYALRDRKRIPELVKKCGIAYARTTNSTHNFALPENFLTWDPTCHHNDTEFFDLAENFLLPNDIKHPWRIVPKIFYLWGHSYEFNNMDNWDRLESICQKIGQKDDVWYATNGEIEKYVSAYNSVKKSCDGHIIHNPTTVPIYTAVNVINEIVINPGETIKI